MASWGREQRARHSAARSGQALRADHGGRRPRPRRPGGDVRRPARAERRRQVHDDEAPHRSVDRRRGRARGARISPAGRVEGCEGAVRRRAPARQPRHDAHRRAEPARLRAPVPDRPARAACSDRARARDGEPRRPARQPGRQALRRHAETAAHRPCARAPAATRAPRRAHRRAGPAGPSGAVGADRPPARRGGDHSHVDALHRGSAAPCRHGPDHVARKAPSPPGAPPSSSPSTRAAT